MASCRHCGEDVSEVPYTCIYCGHTYCQTHRIPESHICRDYLFGDGEGSSTDARNLTAQNVPILAQMVIVIFIAVIGLVGAAVAFGFATPGDEPGGGIEGVGGLNISSDDANSHGDLDIDETEHAILDRINEGMRSTAGVGGYRWNGELAEAARSHSEDMIDREFFNHTNPDGLGPTARGNQFEAPCVEVGEAITTSYYLNEYTREDGGTHYNEGPEDIAESAILSWQHSDEHQELINDGRFNVGGVGVAVGDDGKVYVTFKMCR